MLKTPFAAQAVLTAVAASLLAGCGGGGSDGSDGSSTVHQSADAGSYQVDSGVAQKGPLRRGSVVTVNELLSTNLAPNGKSYTFETTDDLGTFKPTSVFSSPYLETTAQGYFFNELTGETDKEWVVLRGLSNLSTGADKAVNVNVLTAFTKDRIRALVTGTPAKTFAAARLQAQRELLDALSIYNAADLFTGATTSGVTAPGNFMELDLSQARQADQILAAVSGVVTQAGQTGGGVNAFISQIESDLADDGLLNNSRGYATSVQDRLNAAYAKASMGLVASNLNRFYSSLKTPYGRDDLAQWVDSSGGVDRVIDRYKSVVTNATAGVEVLSPAYAAGTDDAGQCLSASAGNLYKNGVKQTAPVKAVKGDQFRIGLTPLAGQTSTAFMQRHPLNATLQCGAAAPPTALRLYKSTVTGASTATTALPASYLGANMPSLADWEYTPVYTDLVMHARQFGHPDHPWGGPTDSVPVGADGWPVGDFGIFLMTGSGRAGTYSVSFNGQADVALSASGDTTLSAKTYDAAKNLTTLSVVRGPAAQHMVLTFRKVGSGVKNLKVLRPGYTGTTPPLYTTEFINHIARFKTLRFMDWLRTNGNRAVTSWATRTTPSVHYNSDNGVPWEHIIALGNQTGKDLWINIPLYANDDYVLQLARLLKSTLTSGSKIYVEYSNEVWNSGFTQYGDNKNLATAEVNANPASSLAYDGNLNADMLGFRRTARRLKEISDIFRSVYGDAAMMTTIRPVFSGQVVQPYISQQGLEFIETVYGPPSRYFYALAGAPYFNLGAKQTVDGLTTDDVLAALGDSVTGLGKSNVFEKNIAQARWFNLAWLAYEGGADTFGPGSLATKKAAGLDTRMTDLCKRYLSTWYAAGGETMMWYTAGATNWDTQYGTWGLTNDITNTTAPKIKCMDQTLAGAQPAVQGRNAVPGTVNALAWVGSEAPFGTAAYNAVRYMHPGGYVDYALVAPAGGTYTLTLVAEAGQTGNKVDVSLNGRLVAPMFELLATGWNAPAGNPPITVTLNKGYNTVRIRTRVETTGFGLSALVVR